MSLNFSPITWGAGNVLTAAQLNAQLRDALTGLQASWDSYTPTMTSNLTSPTNYTASGAVLQIGKTIIFRAKSTASTGWTTGTGNYFLSLPSTPVDALSFNATGIYVDASSSNRYAITCDYISSNCRMFQAATSPLSNFSATSPVVPAVSDVWAVTGVYEQA